MDIRWMFCSLQQGHGSRKLFWWLMFWKWDESDVWRSFRRRRHTYRRDKASGWNCASCGDASCLGYCHWHPLHCAVAGSTSDQYSWDCDDPWPQPLVGAEHLQSLHGRHTAVYEHTTLRFDHTGRHHRLTLIELVSSSQYYKFKPR